MSNPNKIKDEILNSLALPMRSVSAPMILDHAQTMGENKTFGEGKCLTDSNSRHSVLECSFVNLGEAPILSGKTTPICAWEWGAGASSITMCYTGHPQYADQDQKIEIGTGEILAVPRNGGRISTGYLSSINFPIVHEKLSRTMRAMQCSDNTHLLQQALAIKSNSKEPTIKPQKLLFDFFAYIDLLLAESQHIGKAMALQEQIYRLLAIALDQSAGTYAKTQKRWRSAGIQWRSDLDELVDYIRENARQELTLTDLEARSHYSARHLQNLFREKFNCTPMQFVRRQRLSAAMEKLQTAGWDDSVTSIGRDCGYRFTSNFSSDFHREYGVAPSVVLRASRGRGNKFQECSRQVPFWTI